ncbi:30S ribosomal protein S19e [Thermogladius sp. 4427co]|uniref:30S ribosomal protein S19e n=1 Tax=Thermogladius sp. 4427co TaxID=3450718 RepID=UPI003F7B31CE
MVNVLEVPADRFIKRLAQYIKENIPEVKPPSWYMFVKTGSFKEKPPTDLDWWYIRAASILRKLYKTGGPIGLSEFRTIYGGRQRRGVRPPIQRKAGGGVIRRILQQLEQAQLVRRTKKGRVLTPQAIALMDRIAFEIAREYAKENPEYAKYLASS